MYRVPFRQVYCDTIGSWLKETIWCHLVIKLFPYVADLGSDGLRSSYLGNPELFYEQYRWLILRANEMKSESGPH